MAMGGGGVKGGGGGAYSTFEIRWDADVGAGVSLVLDLDLYKD
jgi:hypothetical protein